jgi:hypothetical protein
LTKFLESGGAKIQERHWLANAFSANIDASQLAVLEADPQVKEVAPTTGGRFLADIPLVNGRNAMNSDPYFNTPGLTGGFIALLDSGIRFSHVLLSGRTSWVRDCVNGFTNNCGTAGPGLTLNPSDVMPNPGHGTGVASIMSGKDALGANNRGVTAIAIDSFRVGFSNGGIDVNAVVRGYAAAVAGGDNVVNASFDCASSTCSDAANNTFDAGLVVVAAVGNDGATPTNHVADPATGKKVLAVGALDPVSLVRMNYSSTGPSPTSQTKPDLMAISGSYTDFPLVANDSSDTAMSGQLGTSFASPFVTGGAGLMSRWLKISFGSSVAIAPGQTNAMLIASGTNFSTPAWDNQIGAGRLSLPTNATLYGGKVTVTQAATVDVPINVTAPVQTLDVAIWWPEGATHNDIDLSLIRPDSSLAGNSGSINSIWEKVHVATGTTGTWKIRLFGYSVTGSQTVYVAGIRR